MAVIAAATPVTMPVSARSVTTFSLVRWRVARSSGVISCRPSGICRLRKQAPTIIPTAQNHKICENENPHFGAVFTVVPMRNGQTGYPSWTLVAAMMGGRIFVFARSRRTNRGSWPDPPIEDSGFGMFGGGNAAHSRNDVSSRKSFVSYGPVQGRNGHNEIQHEAPIPPAAAPTSSPVRPRVSACPTPPRMAAATIPTPPSKTPPNPAPKMLSAIGSARTTSEVFRTGS